MKASKTGLTLIIVLPLLVIAIIVAVYFFYRSMNEQQDTNEAILHKFGFSMTPSSPYSESEGVLGAKQIPPTFPGENLSPVEKVIKGLMDDKDRLVNENERLQERIQSLQKHVDTLEDYKRVNEHFAPNTLNQELADVRNRLKQDITNLPDFRSFSRLRLDLASEAGVSEYRRYIEQNRLMLKTEDRQQIVDQYLPTYAFCVAKAVDIAANNRTEEQRIFAWLKDPHQVTLNSPLKEDVEALLPPCQLELRKKLASLQSESSTQTADTPNVSVPPSASN